MPINIQKVIERLRENADFNSAAEVMALSQADARLAEVGPCDGCSHNARCATGQACEQFALFSGFGGTRWRQAPRQPNAAIYARLNAKREDQAA